MSSSDGFKVEGLTKVTRALKEMGLEVEDLKEAFSTIAKEGAERVSRHAPAVSGRLRGDIRGNRAKLKAVVIAGRKRIPYAGPINYGWPKRNIKASGFMQKGDEEMRPIAIKRLEEEINRQIRLKVLK